MSYIIYVNPLILSLGGTKDGIRKLSMSFLLFLFIIDPMEFQSILSATAISAACIYIDDIFHFKNFLVSSLFVGLFGNLPFGMAPVFSFNNTAKLR